jgi:hypothetical protein
VIDLLEKTLRFYASGEQLTLKGLFFSCVFDEPTITAGLDAWEGDLGRTERSKQRKQQPDAKHFLEFHGEPHLIKRERPTIPFTGEEKYNPSRAATVNECQHECHSIPLFFAVCGSRFEQLHPVLECL